MSVLLLRGTACHVKSPLYPVRVWVRVRNVFWLQWQEARRTRQESLGASS